MLTENHTRPSEVLLFASASSATVSTNTHSADDKYEAFHANSQLGSNDLKVTILTISIDFYNQ